MKHLTMMALSLSSAMLAACGGGDSGGSGAADGNSGSAAPASFALEAAYAKIMSAGATLNGSAADGADTYTLNLTVTPATDELFEGVVRKKSLEAITLRRNGAPLTSASIESFYNLSPFTSRGARYADGSIAVLTSSTGSFPTSARVGESGTLGTLTTYVNASKATVRATTVFSWALQADSSATGVNPTAYACLNSVVRNAAGNQTAIGFDCYRIDINGNALGLRFTFAVPGKTLVFQ